MLVVHADLPQIKPGEGVKANLKAEIGFMNEKIPETYQKKPVYVCLLAETSDGHKVHFCRIRSVTFPTTQGRTNPEQCQETQQGSRCAVLCENEQS